MDDSSEGGLQMTAMSRSFFFDLDLPDSVPEDFLYTIHKSLLQLPQQEWHKLQHGEVNSQTVAYLCDFCMDLIQTVSECVLSIVMPQLYKHIRTHGTCTTVGLTEDNINTYIKNSLRQALARSLNSEMVRFSRCFTELLVRSITNTVNSVLALCLKTPLQESVLPVFFVSGTVRNLHDLMLMVDEASAVVRTGLINYECSDSYLELFPLPAVQEDVLNDYDYPEFESLDKSYLRSFLIGYITRLVHTLRNNSQISCCDSNSSHKDVYVIVSSDTQILTVDRKELGGLTSNLQLAAVPDSSGSEGGSETWPFSDTEKPSTKQGICQDLHPDEVLAIESTADELVNTLWPHTQEEEERIVNDRLDKEVINSLRTRLTQRLFVITLGWDVDEVPEIPEGQPMSEMVTFRRVREDDPGLTVHGLYLKTEEILQRSVQQVLHWVTGYVMNEPWLVSLFSYEPRCMPVAEHGGGDPSAETDSSSEESSRSLSPLERFENARAFSVFTLLIGEVVTNVGVSDTRIINKLVRKALRGLQFNIELKEQFEAFLLGRSYRSICQGVITELLKEYGSAIHMYLAVRAMEPTFAEDLVAALKNQLNQQTGSGQRLKTYIKKCKMICCNRAVPPHVQIPIKKYYGEVSECSLSSEVQQTPEELSEIQSCLVLSRLGSFMRSFWDRIALRCCCSTHSEPEQSHHHSSENSSNYSDETD